MSSDTPAPAAAYRVRMAPYGAHGCTGSLLVAEDQHTVVGQDGACSFCWPRPAGPSGQRHYAWMENAMHAIAVGRAELEPIPAATPPTPITVVAAIARLLRHAGAPTSQQEREAVSVRHLAALMHANAVAENELHRAWGGVYDWTRVDEHPWRAEHQSGTWITWLIRRTTATGRLLVEATDVDVSLSFYAGPEPDSEDRSGRLCAYLYFSFQPAPVLAGIDARPALLADRPDRLDLLAGIDRALAGLITRELEAAERLGSAEAAVIRVALAVRHSPPEARV